MLEQLECNLELLCLTGVEDKLQHNVKHTLELLRNAGIKVGAIITLILNEFTNIYNVSFTESQVSMMLWKLLL